MKKLSDILQTFFLILFTYISRILTRKMRTRYGKILGLMIYAFSRKRREITLSNLELAFPEKTRKEIKRIALESFQSLGITFAELFVLNKLSEKTIKEYIVIENLEEIEEVYSRGKGIIFISGHLGNWEIMAYAFGIFTSIPMTIIVKSQKNKIADSYLNKIRTATGNRIIPMHKAAFEIVKKLKQGETIAILADQAAQQGKDIFVDLFGRPASTYEAPAQLALRLGAPIIIGFPVRKPDGTYSVRTQELTYDGLDNSPDGIEELTKRHVKILEEFIRLYPGQWVWQHRKWKHQPKSTE